MLSRLDGLGMSSEIASILTHPEQYGIGDIAEMRRAIMERLKLAAGCGATYGSLASEFAALERLEGVLDTKHQDIENFRP
jgi:hypothetical protein